MIDTSALQRKRKIDISALDGASIPSPYVIPTAQQLIDRQEKISATPKTPIQQLIATSKPIQKVADVLKTAFVGRGQDVDIASNLKFDTGLLGLLRPFGIGKPREQKATERIDLLQPLVDSGEITPQRVEQIVQNTIASEGITNIQKGLPIKKPELTLTLAEKSALRPVVIEETLDKVFGALDFVSLGTIKPITRTAAQKIANSKIANEIADILMGEIPTLKRETADVFGRALTQVDDVDDVQRVINRTELALQEARKAKTGVADEFKVGDVLDPQGKTNMEGKVTIREITGNTLKFTDEKGNDFAGMSRSTVRDLIKGGSWTRAVDTRALQAPVAPESARTAPITPKVENIAPELQPLAREAQKYSSAEEFVKGQTPVFRGGDKTGFDSSKVTDFGVSVAKTPESASFFSGGQSGLVKDIGRVQEFFLDSKAKVLQFDDIPKNLTDDLQKAGKGSGTTVAEEKAIVDYARKQGFDAVDLAKLGEDEIRVVNPDILKTKSQLTDFYNKVKETPSIPKKRVVDENLENLRQEIEVTEDVLADMPGKGLVKYVSRETGELPEISRKAGTGKFNLAGDTLFQDLVGQELSQGGDVTVAQEMVDAYNKAKAQLVKLKNAYREAKIVTRDEKILKELGDKVERANERLANFAEKFQARIRLTGLVEQKQLQKWDNVREAMELPPISQMNIEQFDELVGVLSQYREGDIFLTTRQLETINKTELAGLRTEREVLEHLAKKTGLTEIPKDIKPHPWLYDTQLARQEPFYRLLVDKYNIGYLKAAERAINVVNESDKLINAARNSRPSTIWEKLIPTDNRIVQWREADEELRSVLSKDMTPEELAAARFQDKYVRQIYDDRLKVELERKFTSRFENQYYPHIRRGFLEAWKEDGFIKAAKEEFKQFKQDEATLNILNEKTGEILPYSKWNRFEQFRSGDLIPSQNAALSFKTYVHAVEKVRQFDEFIPEMMIYAHTLTPKQMTERGLMMNDTLQQFFKKWINSKKGRVERQLLTPGSKEEWALRTGIALLRMRDLGLNLGTQLSAVVGEQAGNVILTRTKYPLGIARLATKQGQAITKKYENFVGKSIYDLLSEPSADIGDKLMTGVMGLFGSATRKSNQTFLLSMMTEEEFKTGTISVERLAFLRNKLGRYRVVEGAESVIGKSAEAAAVKQNKRWAIPMIITTAGNLKFIVKNIRSGKKIFQSEEGAELLTATLLMGTIALGTNAYYTELKEKRDRNIVEDLIFKTTREALTLIGALDPRFIVGFAKPRLVSFLEDLADSLVSIAKMEEYKTSGREGELKGVNKLQRILTPAAINPFVNEPDRKTQSKIDPDILKKYGIDIPSKDDILKKYNITSPQSAILDKYK
ncbi:MAG: hypothetical protein AAB922_05745 [Patescibacteria group bacterium]